MSKNCQLSSSKNQTIPVSHLIKLASLKNQERKVKDSPYMSSYASKGRKKSKEGSSNDLNHQTFDKGNLNNRAIKVSLTHYYFLGTAYI